MSASRIELPEVLTHLPGPQTGGNADHSICPLIEACRRGDLIVDGDGNRFADHLSAWGDPPQEAGSLQEAAASALR